MTKAKPLPSLERLDELFEVRDSSLFNRIGRPRAAAGLEAGALNKTTGYRFVCVDYQKFKVHRIVWAMTHRRDPGQLVIDHIDRNKLNNDPSNLRAINKRLNALNSGLYGHNSSGVKGVTFFSRDGMWVAQAKLHGQQVRLGYFKDKGEAVNARMAWEARQWA